MADALELGSKHLTRRPFQASPGFAPLFPTPNHPSYPAAHGGGSGAAGIHYQTDIDSGLKLGRDVVGEVLKRAKADGSSARASTECD